MTTDYLGFSNWLREQMFDNGWTQAEFARRAGLDRGYLNRVLHLEKLPSMTFCLSVATALGLPPEEVAQRAGLLPRPPHRTERVERLLTVIAELSEDDQEFLLQFARLRVEYEKRKAAQQKAQWQKERRGGTQNYPIRRTAGIETPTNHFVADGDERIEYDGTGGEGAGTAVPEEPDDLVPQAGAKPENHWS